jgi:hypothetical protein
VDSVTELAVIEHDDPQGGGLTLFGAASPASVVRKTTEVADALSAVLKSKELYKVIGSGDRAKAHIYVEGWTLLGSMLGVFAVTEWTKPIVKDGQAWGWEARVEARTRDGAVVGAAEAQCTRDENMWSYKPVSKYGKALEPRDDFALRAMAQTRATSRALRQPLGFIVKLAGYEAAGVEEMPPDA